MIPSFYDVFESLLFVDFLLVPCQSIMLLFFMQILSETTSSYISTILVSDQTVKNSFAFICIFLFAPILPLLLGLIPSIKNMNSYVRFSEFKYFRIIHQFYNTFQFYYLELEL